MGAGTWESHHAITALMFRYAEVMDAADFDGIAALFADGADHQRGRRWRDRRPRRGAQALRADEPRARRRNHSHPSRERERVRRHRRSRRPSLGAFGVRRVPADGRVAAPADRLRPLPRHVRRAPAASGASTAGTSSSTTSATCASTSRSTCRASSTSTDRSMAAMPRAARRVPLPIGRHRGDDRRGRGRRQRRRDRGRRGPRAAGVRHDRRRRSGVQRDRARHARELRVHVGRAQRLLRARLLPAARRDARACRTRCS